MFYDRKRHDVDVFLDFFVAKFTTDKSFNTINSVFGVGHTLALRNLADQSLATFVYCDHARCRTVTFRIRNNLWFTRHQISEGAVCCTEVDSNNFTHILLLVFL